MADQSSEDYIEGATAAVRQGKLDPSMMVKKSSHFVTGYVDMHRYLGLRSIHNRLMDEQAKQESEAALNAVDEVS